MNWFTKKHVSHIANVQKKALIEKYGGCIHVTEDPSLLFIISSENDIWGSESHCLCEECYEKIEVAVGLESVVCHDCYLTWPRKDTISWKWYDFYAPQGDEPLIICKECQKKEKHLQRVATDKADYEDEMNDYY